MHGRTSAGSSCRLFIRKNGVDLLADLAIIGARCRLTDGAAKQHACVP